jgi:hypothetical protein
MGEAVPLISCIFWINLKLSESILLMKIIKYLKTSKKTDARANAQRLSR